VKIREIPKDGKRISIKKDNEWFMGMGGKTDVDIESLNGWMNSEVDISLQYNSTIVIEGDVYADILLRCVKCLESFHNIVNKHFVVNLEPYDKSSSTSRVVSKAELDTEFYLHDEFNPDTVVFEQIMLSLSLYPLCRYGCKGLCPYCGVNLNEYPEHKCKSYKEDNSFSVQLKKIKNNL